ncbi:hypothetical protein BC629DRAFT_1732204 [Irpex lacteus]|nr:hypothetical protein BC629DRAFT_1732204 [Irpex lacteus]
MSQIQFTSLHNQAGLVSLEAARCNPSIVYRSLDIMYPSPAPTPAPIALPQTQGTFKLIPLAAAQAKKEIKYRSEGFEMKEARQCYLRLRMERWSQWPTEDTAHAEDRGLSGIAKIKTRGVKWGFPGEGSHSAVLVQTSSWSPGQVPGRW